MKDKPTCPKCGKERKLHNGLVLTSICNDCMNLIELELKKLSTLIVDTRSP